MMHSLLIDSLFFGFVALEKLQALSGLAWLTCRDKNFKNKYAEEFDAVYLAEKFINREDNSAIGNGVAVLHHASTFINENHTAFIKFDKAISWDAADGADVDMVAVLLSPLQNKNTIVQDADELDKFKGLHLQRLSRATRFLMDEAFLKNLRNQNTAAEFESVLKPYLVQMDASGQEILKVA